MLSTLLTPCLLKFYGKMFIGKKIEETFLGYYNIFENVSICVT